MSWLDETEAADPAYPDPDADPWSSPGYVPDTLRGLPAETGAVIGERARQQSARAAQPGGRAITLDEPWTAGRDWRSIRDAEARARDAGLRAGIPRSGSQRSAGYQADALAWGNGRGIGPGSVQAPDGPEAGE